MREADASFRGVLPPAPASARVSVCVCVCVCVCVYVYIYIKLHSTRRGFVVPAHWPWN